MRARLTEVDEYVAELERDAAGVANQRVRITTVAVRTRLGLTEISIVAGAKVLSAVPGHEDFDLVELRRYVGDLWGNPDADDAVRETANALVAELREKLEPLGFVIAGGMYLEEAHTP